MIIGTAFCSQPPAMVPQVGGRSAEELADLRDACCQSIVAAARRDAHPEAQIVVLGGGETSALHSPVAWGSFDGLGVPYSVALGSPGCGGRDELPLSLTVVSWLLREALGPRTGAVGFSIGPDFASSRAAIELLSLVQSKNVVLIAAGDGSARRTEKAPGYVDDRAVGYDAQVAAAFVSGRPEQLGLLDVGLGEELLSSGARVWSVVAGLLDAASYRATLRSDASPWGVQYFAADWLADA